MLKIKPGEIELGDFLLERHRFKRNPDTIWEVIKLNREENHMLLKKLNSHYVVSADIDCYHSYGSRFTWLTYKLEPNDPMVLLYAKD